MSFVNSTQFKIPNTNNYKSINITNFTGTNLSENIFENDNSGCSDSENVYVNEQNILAVRPRLKHTATLQNVEEVYKATSIAPDQMVYYVKNTNDVKNIIISDKTESGYNTKEKVIKADAIGDDASFFKTSNGDILVTSSNGMFKIGENGLENVVKEKEVYIPLTRTNMTFGDELSGDATLETPNVLAETYHRQYPVNLNTQDIIPKEYVENRTWDTSNIFAIKNSDKNDANYIDIQPINYINYKTLYGITDRGVTYLSINYKPNDADSSHTHKIAYGNTKDELNKNTVNLDNTVIFPLTEDYDGWRDVFYQLDDSTDTFFSRTHINKNNVIMNDKHIIHFSEIKLQQNTGYQKLTLYGFLYDYSDELKKIEIPITGIQSKILSKTKLNQGSKATSTRWSVAIDEDDKTLYLAIAIKNYTENDGYTSEIYHVNVPKESLFTDKLTVSQNHLEYTGYYDIAWCKVVNGDITSGSLFYDNGEKTLNTHVQVTDGYTKQMRNKFSGSIKSEAYIDRLNFLSYGDYNVLFTVDKRIEDRLTVDDQDSQFDSEWELYTDAVHSNIDELMVLSREGLGVLPISKDVKIYQIPETNTQLFMTNTGVFVSLNHTNQNVGLFPLSTFTGSDNKKFLIKRNDETITIIPIVETIENETIGNNTYTNLKINILYSKEKSVTINKDPYKQYFLEIVKNENYIGENGWDFKNVALFDNVWWFYGSEKNKNTLRWSFNTKLLYVPDINEAKILSDNEITGVIPITTSQLAVFQQNATTILAKNSDGLYLQYTLKTPKGCMGNNQAVVIPTTNIPLVINEDSVAIITQSSNGVVEDSIFSVMSQNIFEKFATIKNKDRIKTHVHSYYVYFYWTDTNDSITRMWVLDCRTSSWFYWTLPIVVVDMYETDTTHNNSVETETRLVTDTDEFVLTTTMIKIDENDDTVFNELYESYVDELKTNYRRIPWFWKSRIQILGTVNYLKKITGLQLIFSDNARAVEDSQLSKTSINNNSMFYKIKTYRKKSRLLDGYFSGHLDGVGTQRIKLRLPKCDFAELTLSNYDISDDGQFDIITMFSNGQIIQLDAADGDPFEMAVIQQHCIDRLHLIGITFKILLSEALNG